MTKIDSSFMERLGEVLYDEKKAVNYKMISVMLGVHVNIAKQMLYHLYITDKKKGKELFATYYLSGMMSSKALASLSSGSSGEVAEAKGVHPDSESYLVLLCKDVDLEEYKAKFSRVFAVHVYALSAFPLDNYDVLERLGDAPLVDNEGRKPVDFGPISCNESNKFRVNVPAAPVVIESKKPVIAAKKTGVDSKDKDEDVKVEKGKSAQPPAQKSTTKVPPIKDNKDRIKNMFASAASKPKPKKADKVEDAEKSEPKKVSSTSSKPTNKPDSIKAKNNNAKKRKRIIQDILSSSESEDEGKKSEDEDDSLPESPIPKKRIQIESDSDDDFKETPHSAKSDKPEQPKVTPTPGSRKKLKMVSNTYFSEDGFLVTDKKAVMVSDDESTEANEGSSGNDKQSAPALSKSSKDSQSDASKLGEPAKSSSKPTKTSSVPAKTKQPSLMSFFKKK